MKTHAQQTARSQSKIQRATNATKRAVAGLGRASKTAFRAVVSGARRAGVAIKSLHRKTVALGKRGFSQIVAGSRKMARGVGIATGIMISAYGGAALAAGQLVGTASDFEKFQTILETTEGSAKKAEIAMKWVSDFAVKTPYELDQVTDAFVKMRAYGLDPTNGLLKTLGDTSAAMGKPLIQAVEAVADSVTGENERLKEFGIKASKAGQKITYAYTNAAGKAVEIAVKASDRMAIQQKLMDIMNEKYAGSMGRLSATWAGMMSNLSDQWMKFQLMIMKSGLFDWMKDKLKSVLDTINQMEANGTLQEWASKIGKSIQTTLENAVQFATKAYDVISVLSEKLSLAAEFVGGWENLAIVLGGIAFGPTLVATAAGLVQIASGLAMLGTALLANPVGLAIAALAVGVYLIYKNWDAVGPYFKKLWSGLVAGITAAWDIIKQLFAWSPMGLLESTFGAIPAKIAGYIGQAADMAGAAWSRLRRVMSSDSAVDIAARDPVSIEQATKAATQLEGALNGARSVDMSGVSNKLNALKAEAAGLKSAVASDVTAAQSYLAGQSFYQHGVRLMDTMAAGIKARAQIVVDQIRATMQQVRNHLPSSPAKVGPLSDIHRLKFGETIAKSIRPGPMVKAMSTAAAATMAVAGAAVPSSAAVSALPKASQARSANGLTGIGQNGGAVSGNVGSGGVTIHYNPTIHLSGDARSAKDEFVKQLSEHSRHLKRLIDTETRRENRKEF